MPRCTVVLPVDYPVAIFVYTRLILADWLQTFRKNEDVRRRCVPYLLHLHQLRLVSNRGDFKFVAGMYETPEPQNFMLDAAETSNLFDEFGSWKRFATWLKGCQAEKRR